MIPPIQLPSCRDPQVQGSRNSGSQAQSPEDSWLPPWVPKRSRRKVAEILRTCPYAGNGVHRWLFVAALQLHMMKFECAEIDELLELGTSNCGRELQPSEVWDAVRNSEPGIVDPERPRIPKWPERKWEQIEAIVEAGITVADLADLSPARLDPKENHAETTVEALFPGNPLLCIGQSTSVFRTKSREEWRGLLDHRQFIVPSPMTAETGTTKEGKLSQHTLDNTGPRKFLVIEFDFAPGGDVEEDRVIRALANKGKSVADICVALHAKLAEFRPLALMVRSGGKSIHGWYPCDRETDDALLPFMRYARSIGADEMTWTRSQFVRMPGGLRGNGKRQEVLYFNPAVLEGAI